MKIKGTDFRFGDVLSVTLDDGKSFVGALIGFDPAADAFSGHDEIEIAEESFIRSLRVDEIASLEKVA